MSGGRKALGDEFCTLYHCPGDCGKRGHGVQHMSTYRHKKLTLVTFDALEAAEQRKLREQRAEVERKARNQL